MDNITKLAAAGYISDEEEVSEASGYTVTYRSPVATPSGQILNTGDQRRVTAPTDVDVMRWLLLNTSSVNIPLTAREMNLLKQLSNAQPNRDMIKNDARRLETAMKRAAGLEVGNDPEKQESTPAAPRQNANTPQNGAQGNLLANYGTSEGAKKGWDKRGRGQHEAIGQTGTAKSLGLEKLSALTPDPASSHSHPGRARKALTRGFMARSIDGQDVHFSKGVLDHWESTQPPKTPEEQNRRLRRLSEAVRAVKNPHEVWESHNGQKTYLRVYKDDAGKFAMSGFVTGKDGQVRSFFHSRRLNGAEKMRKGTLKYKR